MKNFRAETLKWRREEMTAEDYGNVERVLSDDTLLEMGALCLAIEEGNYQDSTFENRVREILKTPGMHLEAAIYLTYNKSANLEEAQDLFKRLQQENSFKAPILSGLKISKNIKQARNIKNI